MEAGEGLLRALVAGDAEALLAIHVLQDNGDALRRLGEHVQGFARANARVPAMQAHVRSLQELGDLVVETTLRLAARAFDDTAVIREHSVAYMHLLRRFVGAFLAAQDACAAAQAASAA